MLGLFCARNLYKVARGVGKFIQAGTGTGKFIQAKTREGGRERRIEKGFALAR